MSSMADHTQDVRVATNIYDEGRLPNKAIWAQLNAGWKQVCRHLFAHDACIHKDLVAGQAIYTPEGMQTTILGVKRVEVNGIPLVWDSEYFGLKSSTRQTNETGAPRRFIVERRGPYGFSIVLNPTPNSSETDALWIWVWDECPQVRVPEGEPELPEAEQMLGQIWAIRNVLLGLNDKRWQVYDRDYEKERARLRLMHSMPNVVPMPGWTS